MSAAGQPGTWEVQMEWCWRCCYLNGEDVEAAEQADALYSSDLVLWLRDLLGKRDEMTCRILNGEFAHAIKSRAFRHHFFHVV